VKKLKNRNRKKKVGFRPNPIGIPIRGKCNDAHSAWLEAEIVKKNCYASGEYISNYEYKVVQVNQNGDPLPMQRERTSRNRIMRFQGTAKVG
jgi:hypothetical protein